MNRGEFNVWLKRHQMLFPNLSAWLEQHAAPAVVIDAWAKAMESCHSVHAADATDRMLRGVPPLVAFNDWSTLPAVVIAHCRPLGSGKAERSGDGNYVSGAAVNALRKAFREQPPEDDAETFNEFQDLIDVMDPDDFDDTKNRILDRFDDKKLGMKSAYRLILMARQRADGVNGGNLMDGLTRREP
jgi:hypothetical protein